MQLSDEQNKIIEEQKKTCIFCNIISRKIQSEIVYEDDKLIALLDINPASRGHVLIMPKEHYPLAVLIPTKEFDYFIRKCKDLCECTKKAMVNFGYTFFIANGYVAGQQSNHFLAHIIPNDSIPPNFEIPRKKIDIAQIQRNLIIIKQNLVSMMNEYFAQLGRKPKITEKKVLQIIQENEHIKKAILENTESFKKAISTNPQLSAIFSGFDIDYLKEKLKHSIKIRNDEKSTEIDLVIYEDEEIVVLIGDGNEGHIIVKPRKEIKSLDELSHDTFSRLGFASLYSSMILFQLLKADGTNIILNDFGNGLEFNVFSRKYNDGLNFIWTPKEISDVELKKIKTQIKDKCDLIGVVAPPKQTLDLDKKRELVQNSYAISSLRRRP